MTVTDKVEAIVAPILESESLELVDVEMAGSVLRILVDQPGGVGMDKITSATRLISRGLDSEDPMPGRYTLEVSSPGLERPLRRPEHFAAAVGVLANVKTHEPIDGRRRFKGVITAVDEDSVHLDAEDFGEVVLSYSQISKARTVYEWEPAPKPGKGSRPGKRGRKQRKGERR